MNTILTLANGRNVDLTNITAADISFEVIAEHLAKVNRFNGATRGVAYSVAQHLVECADAALEATKDKTLAAYVFCHDMHEAFIGDITSPMKNALLATLERCGVASNYLQIALGGLTSRIDTAIHEAAGLKYPLDDATRDKIDHWDRTLFLTEWRDVMRHPFEHDPLVPMLVTSIRAWPWGMAKVQFLDTCTQLLPCYQWGNHRPKPPAPAVRPTMTDDASSPTQAGVVR